MASSSEAMRLVLIDGSGFIFRAFHAIPLMTDPSGTPVNAVYGFTNMIMKLVKEHTATHMAVIFDAGRKTFRNDIYPAYKAHRPPPPEELIPQFALVREAAQLLGLPTIEQQGWEADDLIASYAKATVEAGGQCTIISSDKDLMQLINDQVSLLDPIKEKPIDAQAVKNKFGVEPSHMVSLQALMGDSVDNVPGVPGIGPKTAAALIQEYGNLESVLAAISSMKPSKRKDNLEKHQEDARISYQLVQLRDNIPLPVALDQLTCCKPNEEKLIPWLQNHGFRSILARWGKSYQPAAQPVLQLQQPSSKVNNTAIEISYGDYKTVRTIDDLKYWVKEAQKAGFCALDTETDNLNAIQANMIGFSIAVSPGNACYVPLGHQDENGELIKEQIAREDAFAVLKILIEDQSVLKIFQNAKYDFLVMENAGLPPVTPYDDTLILSFLQSAGLHGQGMDELAKIHLNHETIRYDDVTGTGRNRIPFSQVTIDKATAYAAEDADVTLRLWYILRPELRNLKVLNLYEQVERPLIGVLTRMEQEGILIDSEALKKLSEDFSARMAEKEKEIHHIAGETFNIASPKQLGEILFDKMSLPGGKRMKTGAWGTDSKVLQELSDQGHVFADHILSWRQLAKLKSTYTDALINCINPKTGRVHTSFNMVGAVTGRLSSNDPNLQNIPIRTEEGGRIRQAFIASPDNLLVSADYSQIELRLLAHVADIPQLKEAFLHHEDIHARTAAEVFHIPLENMDPLVRRRAKAINFGIIYGISAFGLAKQLGVSAQTAKQYIDTYFKRYPGIHHYMQTTKEQAKKLGYVLTPFGRRCWITGMSAKGPQRAYAERQAINAPLQGGAADIIKRAMIHMDRALKESSLKARILLQVHDELLFEVAEKDAEALAKLAKHVMENTVHLSIPLVVDAGIGHNWSEAH